MRRKIFIYVPVCIMLVMMSWGCARNRTAGGTQSLTPQASAEEQTANVYAGKIVGRSNKAKTISIKVGRGEKAHTMMVRFDGRTKGLNHAVKGKSAIITWEIRGSDRYATLIKPKLAKLPPGVTEIKPADVQKLIDSGADFLLIDSRPANRYAQAHLPGAISLPVDQMKTAVKTLSADKERLLLFYCGGYT